MIRPKWPRLATRQPLQCQCQCQCRASSSASFPQLRRQKRTAKQPPRRKTPAETREWPQLSRRRPAPLPPSIATFAEDLDDAGSDEALAAQLRKTGSTKHEFEARNGLAKRGKAGRTEIDWSALASDAQKIRTGKNISLEVDEVSVTKAASKKNMLLIRGVSKHLTSSDFYRLAPASLASFGGAISKVQQQRHPKTLEPMGCYQVSFASAEAAAAYHDDLHRIQNLARHKISSRTGLWQSTAPEHLLRHDTPEDIDADVSRLTIASPSQPDLSVKREKTSLRYPWAKKLNKLVEPLGYGLRPTVVLVEVFPGGLTGADLAHFVRQDGWERDMAWNVSEPMPIDMDKNGSRLAITDGAEAEGKSVEEKQEEQEKEEEDKVNYMGSRFVIACATDWEAWRFHRRWNQQPITHQDGATVLSRHTVKTSIIHW